MGRLREYLTEPEAPPVYQIDFGEQVTSTVANVVAQEAVTRLAPTIQALIQQIQASSGRIEDGATKASTTLDDASKALEAAVKAQVGALQADLKKAVKALSDASTKDAKAVKDGVSKALSGLDIPDYTEQLTQIAAAQPVILSAIKENEPEDAPKEWAFTINRNSSGFIQSVTAKAK